eukprot:1145625-Pelagomonas_calceolata.AAC.11
MCVYVCMLVCARVCASSRFKQSSSSNLVKARETPRHSFATYLLCVDHPLHDSLSSSRPIMKGRLCSLGSASFPEALPEISREGVIGPNQFDISKRQYDWDLYFFIPNLFPCTRKKRVKPPKSGFMENLASFIWGKACARFAVKMRPMKLILWFTEKVGFQLATNDKRSRIEVALKSSKHFAMRDLWGRRGSCWQGAFIGKGAGAYGGTSISLPMLLASAPDLLLIDAKANKRHLFCLLAEIGHSLPRKGHASRVVDLLIAGLAYNSCHHGLICKKALKLLLCMPGMT